MGYLESINMKKKGLIITFVVVGFILAFFITIPFVMLNMSIGIDNPGKGPIHIPNGISNHYPQARKWADSLWNAEILKDTFIYNEKGLRMHAFYATAPSLTSKTAVIVHGYTDNATGMLRLGHMYHHHLGYNILLPDLHYSGLSEGDAFQMGWFDRKDVLQWMDTANSIFGKNTQMVVHGISMGAATTMMVSGESQPEYVKCFIEDCGYTSVWDEFSHVFKRDYGLSAFPILHLSSMLCKWKYDWSFQEASSIEQVKKSLLPMFFIHGDKDDYVPTWMVYELYNAKPQPKELWIVPNAGHDDSYRLYREEYTEKVKQFTDKYIQ